MKAFHFVQSALGSGDGAGEGGGGGDNASGDGGSNNAGTGGDGGNAGDAGGAGAGAGDGSGNQDPFVFPENWKDGLEDDLKNDPSLGPITDVKGLVKSFVHAQRQMGKDRTVLPGDHSTPEQWTELFQKLGLPGKIEEYNIKVPEGAKFQDGFLSQLKEVGFKAGILPSQMDQFMGWYAKANQEASDTMLTQHKQQAEEALNKLKTEWGQAYNDNVLLAKNVLKATGIENVSTFMNDSGYGDDPMLIKIFAKLGSLMKDDAIVDLGGPGDGGMSPKDIQGKIDAMLGDSKHALNDSQNPGHGAAVKEMEDLFKMQTPAASGQ